MQHFQPQSELKDFYDPCFMFPVNQQLEELFKLRLICIFGLVQVFLLEIEYKCWFFPFFPPFDLEIRHVEKLCVRPTIQQINQLTETLISVDSIFLTGLVHTAAPVSMDLKRKMFRDYLLAVNVNSCSA